MKYILQYYRIQPMFWFSSLFMQLSSLSEVVRIDRVCGREPCTQTSSVTPGWQEMMKKRRLVESCDHRSLNIVPTIWAVGGRKPRAVDRLRKASRCSWNLSQWMAGREIRTMRLSYVWVVLWSPATDPTCEHRTPAHQSVGVVRISSS